MRHNTPRLIPSPIGLLLRALLLCGLAVTFGANALAQRDASAQWQLTLENDLWGDDTDGHYTHGTRVTRLSTDPARWVERTAAQLPCRPCRDLQAVEWGFG